MSNKITLKKFTGKSKKSGKDFQAYELRAGLFSTLIFPRDKIQEQYLDKYLSDSAHEEFKEGLDDVFSY